MSKNIIFKARNEFAFETMLRPYPASTNLPDWWRSVGPFVPNEEDPEGKNLILKNKVVNYSFKKCTPMLDALTSGYIIPLWSDVHVRQTKNGPLLTWRSQQEVFLKHGDYSEKVTPPPGYSNYVVKYMNTWIPITPPGYSVLVTSPFGHRGLPLQAIPAVIDSDKSVLEILPPMWLKDGFEGIIQKGTPLVQITPFKREDWVADFDYYRGKDHEILKENTFNTNIISHYIKNIWSKKSYR